VKVSLQKLVLSVDLHLSAFICVYLRRGASIFAAAPGRETTNPEESVPSEENPDVAVRQ